MKNIWDTANWDALKLEYHDLLTSNHFNGLDIETTGFSPEKFSHIIELSSIRIDSDKPSEWSKFETLIKPPCNIPKKISDLTGITNEMVKDSRGFTHIAKELYSFLGDCVIVAHNAMFEQRFLDYYLNYNQLFYTNQYFDTYKAMKLLFPDKKSKRLDSFLELFNIKNDNWHSANADCYFTLLGFYELRKKYLEHFHIKDNISFVIEDNTFEPEIWNIKSIRYWGKSEHLKSGKSRLYVKLSNKDNNKFANIFYDFKMCEWDYNNQHTNVPLDFSGITKEIFKIKNISDLRELDPNFIPDNVVF